MNILMFFLVHIHIFRGDELIGLWHIMYYNNDPWPSGYWRRLMF